METITYSKMMFELPISYEYIKECSITERINEHVNVRIVGVLTEEEQMSALEQVSMESMVHIYTDEFELFNGIVTNFEITYLNGVGEFVLCAADESIYLDIVKKSRSFQDINLTFAAIIKQTIGEYSGDFANASQYTVYPQAPIIQYEETDWEFVKRMASYMGTYLQPEAKREGIQIYLGEHEGYKHSPTIYEYVEKSENQSYVTKEDKEYITKTQNSKSIWIHTSENYNMGDKIVMNQELYTIIEKTARMEKEQLMFTYCLQKNEDILVTIHHNKQIIGVSIEGTILAIKGDQLKLQLCIDEKQDEETAYPYPLAVPYTAEGNTGWYMMPQIGEQAFLYIPSEDESDAYISNVMHSEGESNPYMNEESEHRIGTEDNKSLVMKKDELSIQSENNEFYITMMDNEGISIVSEEDIELVVGKNASFQGKKIRMYAKDRITVTTKKTSIIMDNAVDISGDNQRKSVAEQLANRISYNTSISNVTYAQAASKNVASRDTLFAGAQTLQVGNSLGKNNTPLNVNKYLIEKKIKVNKEYSFSIDNRYMLKLEFKTDPKCIKHHIYIGGSADTIASLCNSKDKVIKRSDNNGNDKNVNMITTELERDNTYYLNIIVRDKSKKNVRVIVKEEVTKSISLNLSDNYMKWLTIAEGYTAYPFRDTADNSAAQKRKNITLGIGFSFDKKGTNWDVLKTVLEWSDKEIDEIIEGVYKGKNYSGSKYEISEKQVYDLFKKVSEKKYIPNLIAAINVFNKQRGTKTTYSQQELEAMFDFSYNNGLSPTDDTEYIYSSSINDVNKIIYYYLRKDQKGACTAVKRYGSGNRRRLNQMNLFFFEDYTFLDKSGADLDSLRKKLGF